MRPWGTVFRRVANALSGFGLTWLVQSSVLLVLGLLAGRVLRRSGPAVQSGVYRTTLVAVLISPIAAAALTAVGFDGLSLRLPSPVKPVLPALVPPLTPPAIELRAESNIPVAALRESHGEVRPTSITADHAEAMPEESSPAPAVASPRSPWDRRGLRRSDWPSGWSGRRS